MTRFNPFIELAGRMLIAVIFLMSGLGKIAAYTATAGYMASQGVPGFLLPIVILTEIGGSLCIILGFNTRIVAFLMAGFTMLTALVFHKNFADQIQMMMFMKNVSMTGGFLLLVVHGAGSLGLDRRFGKASKN